MNDRELDKILRATQPPARPADYWDEFPHSVTRQLAQPPRPSHEPVLRPYAAWKWRVGWAAALALIIVLTYGIGFLRGRHTSVTDEQLATAAKYFREIDSLFPNQIRAIALDSTGPRLILADRPNVPASTPLYVKICGPGGCHEFVTFSGQQITVNGENYEVLSDARDRVLLIGPRRVWSESDPSDSIRVTARPLGSTL